MHSAVCISNHYFTIRSIHITVSTFSYFLCRDEDNADCNVREFEPASEPLGLKALSMAHYNDEKSCLTNIIIIYLKKRACARIRTTTQTIRAFNVFIKANYTLLNYFYIIV